MNTRILVIHEGDSTTRSMSHLFIERSTNRHPLTENDCCHNHDPGGVTAISRWSSAATPPVKKTPITLHPGGRAGWLSSPRRGSHTSAQGRATAGSAAPGHRFTDRSSPERAKQPTVARSGVALSGLRASDAPQTQGGASQLTPLFAGLSLSLRGGKARTRGLPHDSWAREGGYRASANWTGDL